MLPGHAAASGPVVIFKAVNEALRPLSLAIAQRETGIAFDEGGQPIEPMHDLGRRHGRAAHGPVDPLDGDPQFTAHAPVIISMAQADGDGTWIEREPVARMTVRPFATDQYVERPARPQCAGIQVDHADRWTQLLHRSQPACDQINEDEHPVATLARQPVNTATINPRRAIDEVGIDPDGVQHIADRRHEIGLIGVGERGLVAGGERRKEQAMRLRPRLRVCGVRQPVQYAVRAGHRLQPAAPGRRFRCRHDMSLYIRRTGR